MKRRLLKVAVIAAVCLGLTARTYAFLGIGDIVFDPSAYAQAVQQLIQLEQQYAQLVQSYQMLRNQFEQLRWNARTVPVNMQARYRAALTPWQLSSATNTYGTTGDWLSAVNTGIDVAGGFAGGTEALQTYGTALASVPADQLPHIKATYGTVELADGATQNAIATIGSLRRNAVAVERAIGGLEEDSLSSAPEMNTEVAVLNKINAANLIAVRNGQDANKLLVAVTESQIIEAKRTRDAEARAINQHIRFMAEGRDVMVAQAAGASEAMLAWRMP